MRDHRAVWVGLSLCIVALVACGDDSSEPIQPAEEPEPDAGDPGTCEGKPLTAFCTTEEPCPASFDEALDSTCTVSNANATVRHSSCRGPSLRVGGGLGATTYHFNGEGELVGVLTESDTVVACSDAANAPTTSEQIYGRECTPEGPPSDAFAIACCTASSPESTLA